MLNDDQIRCDLAKLKEIVKTHKSPEADLATHQEEIDGIQYEVFSKAPRNLYELYKLGLKCSDDTFLVYLEERYTFAETLDMAARLGRTLIKEYRVKPGDRVAICARNSPEWCVTYMAVTMIGATIVPLNSWWKGSELEYGLTDSSSKLAFVDHARFEEIKPFIKSLNLNIVIIKPEKNVCYPEFHSLLAKVVPLSDKEIQVIKVEPEDHASIMYTSGSTGHPKGVLSTHRNIINALYTWRFVKEINDILRPELVEKNPENQPALLANVPLFHVTGSHAQFLASFIYLRKFVMMYKWDVLDALSLIEKEKISIFHGVPTCLLYTSPSPRDLSTSRMPSSA